MTVSPCVATLDVVRNDSQLGKPAQDNIKNGTRRPRGALLSAEGVDADAQSGERLMTSNGACHSLHCPLCDSPVGMPFGTMHRVATHGGRLSDRLSADGRRPPRSLKEGRIIPLIPALLRPSFNAPSGSAERRSRRPGLEDGTETSRARQMTQ